MKTRSQTSTEQKSMMWRWAQDAEIVKPDVTSPPPEQKSMMWRWAQDAEIVKPDLTLTRTTAFIQCNNCLCNNSKYDDKCTNCDTQLPKRPFIYF